MTTSTVNQTDPDAKAHSELRSARGQYLPIRHLVPRLRRALPGASNDVIGGYVKRYREMMADPPSYGQQVPLWQAWHAAHPSDIPEPQRPSLRVLRAQEESPDLTDVAPAVAAAWASTSSTERGEPKILTLDQVLSEPTPERDWLPVLGRRGFMLRGASHLLSAESGAGKTFFLSAVMAELAERGERIAWVYEEGEAMVRERRGLMAAHLSGRPIKGTIGWFAADEIGRPEWIADYAIRQLDPTVIIIDTIANVLRFENENDSAEAARRLRPWSKLAQDSGISVILVHHNNKVMGARGYASIRGASALVAAVDVVLQLDRHGKDRFRRDLRVSKRVPDDNAVYQLTEDGRLAWDDQTAVASRKSANVKDLVYETVMASDGMSLTLADVMSRMPGYADRTLRDALNALARDGDLVADATGRGRGRTWRLPDPEADPVDDF